MKRIIFGLGSNLGDKAQNLNKAVDFLTQELDLKNLKRSKIFENKALLKEGSPKEWDIDFFNIALSANIDIDNFPAEKILEIIKNIETKLGRKKTEIWAPREIDIDILAIENLVINIENKLQIPHRSLLERDFFIKTTQEIEPNWQYPVKGKDFGKKIIEL